MKKRLFFSFVCICCLLATFGLVGCGSKKSDNENIFEAKSYTIEFIENGGTSVDDITVKENNKITEPQEPTKEGYIFYGWYENNDLEGEEYVFGSMPSKNLTLYAKWVEEDYAKSTRYAAAGKWKEDENLFVSETIRMRAGNTYYFRVDLRGKGPEFKAQLISGETVMDCVESASLFKDDGTLLSELTVNSILTSRMAVKNEREIWFVPGEDQGNSTFRFDTYCEIAIKVSKDAKASLNLSSQSYKQRLVTFVSNGGSKVENIVATVNEKITEPENPTRAGHVFCGWYTEEDFLVDEYEFNRMPILDVTLYAKWAKTSEYGKSVMFAMQTESKSSGKLTSNFYSLNPGVYYFKVKLQGWGPEFDAHFVNIRNEVIENCISDVSMWSSIGLNEYEDYTNSLGITDNATIKFSSLNVGMEQFVFNDEKYYVIKVTTTKTINGSFCVESTNNFYTRSIINFETFSAPNVPSLVAIAGSSISAPTEPTWNGYVFYGWYENNDFSGNEYVFNTMPSGEKTLYAKWNSSDYGKSVIKSFDVEPASRGKIPTSEKVVLKAGQTYYFHVNLYGINSFSAYFSLEQNGTKAKCIASADAIYELVQNDTNYEYVKNQDLSDRLSVENSSSIVFTPEDELFYFDKQNYILQIAVKSDFSGYLYFNFNG